MGRRNPRTLNDLGLPMRVRERSGSALAAPLALTLSLFVSACEGDFDPVSQVSSVRILATRADKPIVRPGDSVTIDVLAADGRQNQTSSLKLYSLVQPCEPVSDLYYECYAQFQNQFTPGATPSPEQMVEGTSFQITVSSDVITKHPRVAGSAPFGSVFAFSMACAGQVRFLGLRSKPSPQTPPFGCFDENGAELGSDSFVFAFTRIYAFEDRTNHNPEITSLRVGDETHTREELAACEDPATEMKCPAVPLARCTQLHIDDCPEIRVDVAVPESSQEPDPSSDRGREQLWVDYYSSGGRFEDDVHVLYDASRGKISDTAVKFRIPNKTGFEQLYAVVHDNRGGVNWVRVQLDVQ